MYLNPLRNESFCKGVDIGFRAADRIGIVPARKEDEAQDLLPESGLWFAN